MQKIFFRTLPCLILLGLSLLGAACSASKKDEAANTGAAQQENATQTVTAPTATATDFDPVMPEKVQVAFEQNCKSCHGPDGHGITSIAPDLRKAGRRDLAGWKTFLQDEKGAHASTRIPAMASLTPEDFDAIAGYLADLTQNNPPATKK